MYIVTTLLSSHNKSTGMSLNNIVFPTPDSILIV